MDFGPINALVQLFVYQSTHCDVIAAQDEKPMFEFRAPFRVVGWSNDSFDRIGEYHVGHLVARDQLADKRAAINGYDKDLLCAQVSIGLPVVVLGLVLTIDVGGKRHDRRTKTRVVVGSSRSPAAPLASSLVGFVCHLLHARYHLRRINL